MGPDAALCTHLSALHFAQNISKCNPVALQHRMHSLEQLSVHPMAAGFGVERLSSSASQVCNHCSRQSQPAGLSHHVIVGSSSKPGGRQWMFHFALQCVALLLKHHSKSHGTRLLFLDLTHVTDWKLECLTMLNASHPSLIPFICAQNVASADRNQHQPRYWCVKAYLTRDM